MFNNIKYVGELATAQSPWRDSKEKTGIIPEFIELLGNQKNNYGYEPVYGINFFKQSGEYEPDLSVDLNNVNDWTNEEAKILYQNVTLAICSKYRPKYFGLALEANSYYIKYENDFKLFVQFYKNVYDEIKKISPDTKVFVTFQLEMIKGLGDKAWGFSVEPHWEILDMFENKLDLIVFTSYPELEYDKPDDIPFDYYLDITKHTNTKTAFAEIGWSSVKYDEDDQCKFIIRFMQLTQNINIEFVNWIFMNDLSDNNALSKTGLCTYEGIKKKAWYKWQEVKQLPIKK